VARGPLERIEAPSRADRPRDTSLDGTPASPWRRGTARILDQLVVLTVLFMCVIVRIFFFVPMLVDDLHPDPWGRAFVPQVTAVVLTAVLEVVFVRWSMGQTPGRDRLNVRVVLADVDAPLSPQATIGVGRALARWSVPGLAMLAPQVWPGFVVLALCGLPALFGDHRSLPDRLAGTRVVRFDRSAHEISTKGHDGRHRRRRPSRFLTGWADGD
jgi:uncharacterized RDD family membrane protein YckC